MERIKGQVKDQEELATQVLSWIICAKRPLSTSELQHALAVEVGEPELDEENLSQIEDVVSVCAGLVTVDEESGIIRLVHYTTQEYFERTQKHWFPDAESDITTTCITYLSFSAFESGFCRTDDEFEERLHSNQLYGYAAYNWGRHARKAPTLSQGLIGFLECEAKIEAASQALIAIKKRAEGLNDSHNVPKQMTGLHLAAYFGIQEAAHILLQRWQNVDLSDSYGRTPLSYAAENGHEAVVQLLLSADGIDVNFEDKEGRTALSWAARKEHEAVVKLLLGADGINVNSKDGYGRTALSRAAEKGREAVVKLLLGADGIDVNSKGDEYGWTALSWAARDGHEAVVKLLLGADGIDVNSKDEYGQTALLWAAQNGREAVVKLLLGADGMDVNSKDKYGWTALSRAVENRHEAVVKLLQSYNNLFM